jgi:hypothetical protein
VAEQGTDRTTSRERGRKTGRKKNNKTYYLMDLERTRKGKAEIFRCGERNW